MQDKTEVPTPVIWGVVAVIVLIAGFFLWRAGAPSMNRPGQPTAQDRAVLQKMGEARQRAGGAGKVVPATARAGSEQR
jgi:hypothetical protein